MSCIGALVFVALRSRPNFQAGRSAFTISHNIVRHGKADVAIVRALNIDFSLCKAL